MILPHLKASTREQHERAEAHLNLMDPALDRRRYGDVLRTMRSLYGTLEPRVGARLGEAGRAALDWPARLKVPLLDRDLRALNVAPAADLDAGTVDVFLRDEADAWGAAYVLEGATLGGQLVRRHLEARLGLRGEGTAFYSSYGPLTGPRWRAFGEALEARVAQGPDPAAFTARATDAARRTFGLFVDRPAAAPEGHRPDPGRPVTRSLT
ncbi:biliverdin-producing heme oxygenase [Deinococcus sp. 6YEL10]|uniref:biliverdin-producing heme oxygenase n=1 Tax=Deinococcus sp. 6YEL10 TaxID=2745870 RepID=UPI001E398E6B|nr:biliverdin-producing heme oxygenase [Deinococcus sp. 6YEL10]